MNKILSRPADKIGTLPDALHCRINDLLNNPVYSNGSSLALVRSSLDGGCGVGPLDAASLMANLVLRDTGIAARLVRAHARQTEAKNPSRSGSQLTCMGLFLSSGCF